MDLVPGGARRNLTAKRATALPATVTPAGAPAVTRWQLAADLIVDVRHLSSASIEETLRQGLDLAPGSGFDHERTE